MLYYETVDSETLELLKKLQAVEAFKDMRLCGGTALALQVGHRISVDLDLFGLLHADKYELLDVLNDIGDVTTLKSSKNINIFLLDGVKVDIVNYQYKWLSSGIEIDNICLADKMDIAAMKLAAVAGRGTKKDFIDLYFLFEEYSLHQMLEHYKRKYHDGSEFLVLKSLAYFVDAEDDEMPKMLKSVEWAVVKNVVMKHLEDYLNKSN